MGVPKKKQKPRARSAAQSRGNTDSRGSVRFLGARVLLGLALVALVVPPLGQKLFGWGSHEEFLPPVGSPVVIGDGLVLNVRDQGSGYPVILVHGLPGAASDWADTPARIAAAGYRAISYDRVGYGYSSRVEASGTNFTLASNALELKGLLRALGLKKAAFVGWSYGGGVVQVLAQTDPDLVSHAVLLGSVGPAFVPQADLVNRVVNSSVALPVLKWVASVPPVSNAGTWDKLRAAFASESEIPDHWLPYTQAMMALPGTLETFVAEQQRMDPSVLRPELLRAPTVVLQGAKDRMVLPAVAEDLARRIPNSRLVMVEDGGHMLQVTRPELLTAEVVTLVGKQAG
jgi:pimeloyl-ACP methyl ester carboxylesterase